MGLCVSHMPLCVQCLHSAWYTAGIHFVQTERMHNVWDCGLVGRVTQQVWKRAELRRLCQSPQGDFLFGTELCIFQQGRHWVGFCVFFPKRARLPVFSPGSQSARPRYISSRKSVFDVPFLLQRLYLQPWKVHVLFTPPR